MISTSGALPGALADGRGRPHDRAHLHLVDLGPLQAEPAAARAEHRVRLVQLARSGGASSSEVASSSERQELVQRRVEQADRDREARPSPRRSPRSRTAARAAAGRARRAAPPRRAPGSSPARSAADPAAMNMCSVRQRPMPSAPNSRALAASSGVSAFARTRSRRSSSAQSRIVPKFSSIAGGTSRTGPTITRPVPPSIVITSPTLSVVLADRHRAGARVDREPLAAGDARLAHAARDDRGVRGHPAVRGEDAAAPG